MFQRHADGFGVLSAQHGVLPVHGHGNYHRQPAAVFCKSFRSGRQRGLDIGDIMRGLHQQEIHPSVHQGRNLLVIGVRKFVERDTARHEQGLIGRTHGTSDITRLLRRGSGERGLPGQFHGGQVQFLNLVLKSVLGEHKTVGAESVGLHHVGSGGEIIQVHLFDDVRP